MMKDDGGQAFPVDLDGSYGMTLRDYFAGQALAGCEVTVGSDFGSGFFYEPYVLAERCYAIADAMLKARK